MLTFALTLALALITPCPTEDATACTWDAATHGNGQGHSYIAVSDALVIYLPQG